MRFSGTERLKAVQFYWDGYVREGSSLLDKAQVLEMDLMGLEWPVCSGRGIVMVALKGVLIEVLLGIELIRLICLLVVRDLRVWCFVRIKGWGCGRIPRL